MWPQFLLKLPVLSDIVKIHHVILELLHVDIQTDARMDGRTDIARKMRVLNVERDGIQSNHWL
jgi:hypothetical protein